MTLSRRRVEILVARMRPASSMAPFLTNLARLIDPRLQTSPSWSHCSPQGFVASRRPSEGTGFVRLAASGKSTPGSPLRHAASMILSINSPAVMVSSMASTKAPRLFLITRRGFIFWPFHSQNQGSFDPLLTASMKASVMPTEMLKLTREPSSHLASMNSKISG